MKLPKYLIACMRVIKLECEKHEHCEGCPLRDKSCFFGENKAKIPIYWKFNGNEVE